MCLYSLIYLLKRRMDFFQRQILKGSIREHLFPAHNIRVQFWKFSLILMVLLQFSSCSICYFS